jgi:hypothetical protein
MNCRRETAEMGVSPGNRRVRHPRTPGRTVISAVPAGDSVNMRVNSIAVFWNPSNHAVLRPLSAHSCIEEHKTTEPVAPLFSLRNE